MANTSSDTEDLSARVNELESRIRELEQGLDERAVEFNMVKSAVWEMIVDNALIDDLSEWHLYTNDMNQFPSQETPLYGFDKDGDGEPDTNYVPFSETKWFYKIDFHYPEFLFQGIDPDLVESWEPEETTTPEQIYETELHNVQTALLAAMVDSDVTSVTAGNLNSSQDFTVAAGITVGNYIAGGVASLMCRYTIASDGTVTQVWTPE